MSQGTPTIIGSLAYPLCQSILGGKPGPWDGANPGDTWILACDVSGVGIGPALSAYLATDGITYIKQAGGPACASVLGMLGLQGLAAVNKRPSGNLIDVAYLDLSGRLNTVTFNTSTRVFSAPLYVGVTYFPVPFLFHLDIVCPNTTDQVVVWNVQTGTTSSPTLAPVWYARNVGGTFGAPIRIDPGTQPNWELEKASIIAGNNTLILFKQGTGVFVHGNVQWAVCNGTAVTSRGSTPLACLTELQFTNVTPTCSSSHYDSASDTVGFTFFTGSPGTASPTLIILYSGTTATPSFAIKTIAVLPGTAVLTGVTQIGYAKLTGNSAGSAFDLFWSRLPLTVGLIIEHSAGNSINGSWSSPDLYYNLSAFPPPPGSGSVSLYPIYVNTLTNGNVGVIAGFAQTSISPFFGILYTWPPSLPPPITFGTLTLVQVIVGAGTPTVMTAVGQSVLSGTGGAGPTSVVSGPYMISQLPVAGFTAGPPVLTGSGATLSGSLLTLSQNANAIVTITNTPTPSGGGGGGGGIGVLTVFCVSSAFTPGVFYNQTFRVVGGVPPYIFSLTGSLPAGLTLNTATGQISGIPDPTISPGTSFSYTITVRDSS